MQAQTISISQQENSTDIHLSGCSFLLVRILWGTLAACTLVVFVASLPVYMAQLQSVCTGTDCAYKQLTSEQARLLPTLGLSIESYVLWVTLLVSIMAFVYFVVGTIIAWRKSHDWMAQLFGLTLVLVGTVFVTETVGASHSIWRIPALFLNELAFILAYLVFALFPNGRFVPHWTRWLMVGYLMVAVTHLLLLIFDTSFIQARYPPLLVLTWVGVTVGFGIAQVQRYRRDSTLVQRQQTKWIVLSIVLSILVAYSLDVPTLVFHSFNVLYNLLATALTILVLLLFPLSVSFAILRYRLWDIDVLINRTLVYGSLTVALALVYAGCVLGLQTLLHAFTGQVLQSPVITVASTLATVALVQPLRHRIQYIIDRRFYRQKYDAARTLAAFSATLQGEVDLAELREQLVAVIQETMQPTYVSLWLRQPQDTGHKTGMQMTER